LTDEIRIKCADCADFDLCLQCFGDGVEPSGFTHKNSHRYRVMEVLDFPIFAKDWAADEELLLVEAAEKLGLGNWDAIAEHIGTKTRDECEQHYNSVYLKSPLWPLPIESPQFDLLEARRQLRELAAERAAQPFRKPIIKHSKVLLLLTKLTQCSHWLQLQPITKWPASCLEEASLIRNQKTKLITWSRT